MNIFDYLDYEDYSSDSDSLVIGFENIYVKDDIPGTTIKRGDKFKNASWRTISNILTFNPWQENEIKLKLGHFVVYEKHGEGGKIKAGVEKYLGTCDDNNS